MTAFRLLACSIAVALALASATARAVLSVNEPWVRPGADGRTAEAFMRVKSSIGARLAGVDSFAAKSVTIRAPGAARALPDVALPANETVELKPGALRLELNGLVRRLRPGEHVPITLVIHSADGTRQNLYINAEVRKRTPAGDDKDPHAHHRHGKQR